MSTSNNLSGSRIKSIDALRGFDMFWIMGGDSIVYSLSLFVGTPFFLNIVSKQVEHSQWNGFTFYDLIFPLFLFIVGLTLPLSTRRRLAKGHSYKKVYFHIVKRTLILFVLGLIYNGLFNLDFEHQRYMGVLQRIAICYFFAALIVMNFRTRGQIIWFASILLAYWAILGLIPVPGFGAANYTPEGNLCGYIDRAYLPGSFCCYPYGDNEGFLSTIAPIANVLAGVLSGTWLFSQRTAKKKILGLLIGGIAILVLGFTWGLVFPINKTMWTSTYALVSIGWSMLLLLLFYWIIDIRGKSRWAFPFVVIGMNPITIYVAQGIFDFGIIAQIFIHGFVDQLGNFQQLFTAICVVVVKWLFLYFLYKKKIFLKV